MRVCTCVHQIHHYITSCRLSSTLSTHHRGSLTSPRHTSVLMRASLSSFCGFGVLLLSETRERLWEKTTGLFTVTRHMDTRTGTVSAELSCKQSPSRGSSCSSFLLSLSVSSKMLLSQSSWSCSVIFCSSNSVVGFTQLLLCVLAFFWAWRHCLRGP